MSSRSQLTKDLNDSIKLLLGKQVKILFKNVVRLETKGDKTENRVVVFSPCRVLLLTAKVPTRIDCHFHYLEVQAVESKRGNHLSFVVNEKVYSFLTGDDSTCSVEVDAMVAAFATAIRNIFPTVPLRYIIKKMEIMPESRLQQVIDLEAMASSREIGPCGGFSTQYACMCDYHNMPYYEEVAWDVDNIYVSLKTRELNLKDFDHLEQKDLVPIIGALEFNTWFTKLRAANHVRFSHETMDRVFHVLRKSLSLEELYFDNLGLKADFVNKLSGAIKCNDYIPLHTLDLSYNSIEDKGAIGLAGCTSRLSKGMQHINLAHCGLTCKGVNQLFQGLSSRGIVASTLLHLNLGGNCLKDDLSSLNGFLSQTNALRHLDLSACDIVLENLFGALARGCTTNLIYLNVSKNPLNNKKSKDLPLSFKQFFTNALQLKYINMSSCKLHQEALKNLLLGLACNEYVKEVTLDLYNNALGAQGAHVLESCVHGIRCISNLDISDNNMDLDLAGVLVAIGKNKFLKHLNVARNMNNIKAKHVSVVMDSLVQVIQDEDCVLRSLVIADSRLKSDLHNFLNALGANRCLELIDISGNLIGDSGARLLAKALQINTKLKTVICDRNNVALQGFNDIAHALATNNSLRYMPYPIYDVVPCMKASADRTEAVMKKIQDCLDRNSALDGYHHDRNTSSFSSHSGYVLNSKQHDIARLAIRTQTAIKNVASDTTTTISNNNKDINFATGIVQDADNLKALIGQLQEIAKQKDIGRSIEQKLQQVACDIQNHVSNHMQETALNMFESSKHFCPNALASDYSSNDAKEICSDADRLSEDFLKSIFGRRLANQIADQIRELSYGIASNVAAHVVDQVRQGLLTSHKVLVDNGSPLQRSRLSSSGSSKHGASSDVSITDSSQQSNSSPMKLEYLNLATPHLSIKRKSLLGRKLRPKSVVNSIDELSVNDIPALLPKSGNTEEEEDSVTELPNATTHQLQHLVKGRPRRAKTRAPTRSLLKPDEVCNSSDVGEGLETFFRPGSITPTSDDCNANGFASSGASNDERTPKKSCHHHHHHHHHHLSDSTKSKSTEHLERCSPLSTHKSNSDVSSSSRVTENLAMSRESSEGSITAESRLALDRSSLSLTSTLSKGHSPDDSKIDDDDDTDVGPKLRLKSPPSVFKSRPRSEMRASELGLLSDGSSPTNSTGNTPDAGEIVDKSDGQVSSEFRESGGGA